MLRDVAADVRLDRGVDEGGHRALVLAVLAQHLGADRDDGLGVLAAQHLAHRELVLVVGVGVQEADADRRDAAVAEPAGRGDRGSASSNGRISLPSKSIRPPTVRTWSAATMRGGLTQK